MRRKWFGVKLLFRTEVLGPPRTLGKYNDPKATLVEEQVFVVRALDWKSAAKLARRATAAHHPRPYRNADGQRVRIRRLHAFSACELYDPPRNGAEVFSETRRFSTSVSDEQVINALIPRDLTIRDQRRRQFIAADIAVVLDAVWSTPKKALQPPISARKRPARIKR